MNCRLSLFFVFAVFLFVSVAGCGKVNSNQSYSETGPLIGLWVGEATIDRVRYVFTAEISESELTLSTSCHFGGGDPLQASVKVESEVLENLIKVRGNDIDQTSAGGRYCGAALSPRDIEYEISGEQLTVTNLNMGRTDTLVRVP